MKNDAGRASVGAVRQQLVGAVGHQLVGVIGQQLLDLLYGVQRRGGADFVACRVRCLGNSMGGDWGSLFGFLILALSDDLDLESFPAAHPRE